MNAAFVNGSEHSAIAVFEEDSHGDLVDIHFYCTFGTHAGCAPESAWDEAEWWPAYDFSTDYDTCCEACGDLINQLAVTA